MLQRLGFFWSYCRLPGHCIGPGAEPIAGLIAGIIGGLIVAPISGSHVGVSGPAAGLAVIVYDGIQEADLSLLLAVVIGLAQIALGIVRRCCWQVLSSALFQGCSLPSASSFSSNKSPRLACRRRGTNKGRQGFDVLLLLANISYASATATAVVRARHLAL